MNPGEPIAEQIVNKEICGEETVAKLNHWLNIQLKEIYEDTDAKKVNIGETKDWVEKMKPILKSKTDREIISAAEDQVIEMEDQLLTLSDKGDVFQKEKDDQEVISIMKGKTKKEIVEEITARLNKQQQDIVSGSEMEGVAEDQSGMVWGKATYCHEYSPWTELYETLLFYVDRDKEDDD